MKKHYLITLIWTLCSLLFSGQVMAQSSGSGNMLPSSSNLFGLIVTVDNDGSGDRDMETLSFGFDDAIDVLETFEDRSLRSLFPPEGSFNGYSGISPVDADINYQGVFVGIDYRNSSAILQFEVPDLGIRVSCIGISTSGSNIGMGGCRPDTRDSSGDFVIANEILTNASSGSAARDASEEALEDFLEDSDLANRLAKLLAAQSPTSPLAGNPSSLQSSQTSSSFSKGTDTSSDNKGQAGQATAQAQQVAQLAGNAFPVGAQLGRFRQGDRDVNNYSLPLRYAYEWSDGGEISVALPLGYTTIEDAKVYSVGLELSYTHPINKQWKLTPGINYGLVGSKELLTGAQIGSVSLTSLYKLDKSIVGGEDWSLSIANMFAYSTTFPLTISDIKIDPDLTNQIIKNGLILDAKKAFGMPLNIKAYITDTRFFGDALYSERYDEIGILFSPAKKTFLGNDQGLNFSYLFAEGDIKGFNLSYSYKF